MPVYTVTAPNSRTFGVLGESEFGIGVEGRNNNPDNWQAAMFGYNMGGGIGVGGIKLRNPRDRRGDLGSRIL